MSDALLSPAVGITMAAVSIGAIGYSVRKITKKDSNFDEKKIPMMAVMGAFVFAGQMINFTIPGTGSSGHIGGGILLAAILGPFPALLTIASVLLIQCLFFADGGLLAYGCNVFNMGICACLFAYLLIYKPIIKKWGTNKKNIIIAAIISVVLGLQAGAFGVVLETTVSGVAGIPFGVFVALMQPIHLAIGLIEGIVTAAVLCFIQSIRPEILDIPDTADKKASLSLKKVILIFIALTVIIGGGLSVLASKLPDGLEWSVAKANQTEQIADNANNTATVSPSDNTNTANTPESTDNTSTSGIIGSVITVALVGIIGLAIRIFKNKNKKNKKSQVT